MRADLLLVRQGLAPSRSAAQRLLGAGSVHVRTHGTAAWRAVRKAAEELPEDAELQLLDDAELRWASRAGLKLEGALAALAVPVAGRIALDVGQSTGGFTDVLLQRGAARVVGVDVGHGQLHPRLRGDPRVLAIEDCNARTLSAAALAAAAPPDRPAPPPCFDLVVADLSFISLTHVLPAIAPLLAADGDAVLLVKPQFELQPGQIGGGGLVRDPALYATVRDRVEGAARAAGWAPQAWIESPIRGGDGNTEFFLHARPLGRRPFSCPLTPRPRSASSSSRRTRPWAARS